MPDDARLDKLGCRIHHAADHALAWNVLADQPFWIGALDAGTGEGTRNPVKIPVGNAVLHRHHHGLRAEQLWHIGRDGLDLVCLHRKDHEVLRTCGGVIGGNPEPRHRLLGAVREQQPDPSHLQRLEVLAAGNESHILAGVGESMADVAANRTDAYDRDLHPANLAGDLRIAEAAPIQLH